MDYYEVLGLLPTATQEEIKRAYRMIAARTHPDRVGEEENSSRRFKEATSAYEVLSDPEKREAYDREQMNILVEDPHQAARSAWNKFIDNTLQP